MPRRAPFAGLAALLAVLLLASWGIGERILLDRHRAEVWRDTAERLGALSERLGANLRADLQAAKGLVSLIHLNPQLDQATFERAARPLFGPGSQLRNVAAAPDLVIRLMAPLQGNERAVGLDYRTVPGQFAAVDWARLARETVVAGPLPLVQGGEAVIARLPVYLPGGDGGERFWGVISAVIDVQRLYERSGLLDPGLPIEVALRGRNASGSAGAVFLGRESLFDDGAVTADIELPLGSWHVGAIPKAGWPTSTAQAWWLRATVAGITAALVLTLWLLRRGMRATELAHARASSAQRQVASLVENAPDAMLLVDATGCIVLANAQAERLFGWSRDELLGRGVELLMPERLRRGHRELMKGFLAKATARDIRPATDLLAARRDGSEITVEISLSPLAGDQGMVTCAVVRDVTERKRGERALRRSERRLRAIANNLPVLIAQVDREQRFLFANAAYEAWYGLDPAGMVGQSLPQLFARPEHVTLREQVNVALASGERHRFVAREGQRDLRTTLVPERADDGQVIGLFVLSQDITDLKAVERQLIELATVDHLTGLMNRRSFDEELVRALARARRQGAAMALMYVDADHFKAVNDSLGHAAGDAVLKALADRMRRAVRTTDTVARLGGDEFAIILEPPLDLEGARRVVDKIQRALDAPVDTPAGRTDLRASIGLAWLGAEQARQGREPAALLDAADQALYEAKEGGRNRCVLRELPGEGSSQSPTAS